jgi:peptidoglycan-associated lipoprotein
MTWSRSLIWCATLATLLLAVGACGPKASPDLPAENLTDTRTATTPDRPVTDVGERTTPTTDDSRPAEIPAELKAADEHVRSTGLIGDIYFDFDKYDLKPEARERLSKNADFMKKNAKYAVEIQGHCDERGTNDYNIALADRRANAAREYMVTLGVAEARLKTVSFGEERPVCTDHNESCWWRNRRGEFHLSGQGQ